MVVKTDGSLWATGKNGNGQLGDDSKTDRNKFKQVIDSGVKAVSALSHTMVIKQDGSLWGTGYNGDGQLGFSTDAHPQLFTQVRASG